MKRAGRWLFNFAAALAAVVCIALVVLGIRSFGKVGSLAIDHRGGTCFWVEIERGQLAVWKQRRVAAAIPPAHLSAIQSGESLPSGRPRNAITSSVLGFGAASDPEARFDSDVAMLARLRHNVDFWRDLDPPMSQEMQRAGDRLAAARHTQWQVSAPMSAPLLCLIWIPCLFVAKKRQLYKRKKLGQCLVCGYDLRATPDRCPECGAIPPAAKGAAT